MATAYLFPGQGSQSVGMGKEHFTNNDVFADYVTKANNILGFDIQQIMFEGPVEKLKQTEFTQPAIYLHSVALFKMLEAEPDMVAGHSLGEFSALVACNAVEFEEALKIVRRRGQLMQKAGEENPGTMAAIIGMSDEAVEEACAVATKEVGTEVIAANYNCPGQLVISGDKVAVKKAVDLLKEEGCRLAKMLPVSGAFHSSLMQPAYDGLKEGLEQLNISKPECPIYSNYTGKATTEPEEIRSNILNQLLNPVLWTQTLENMHKNSADTFIEVGPGKVLQGLVKRTLDDVTIDGNE